MRLIITILAVFALMGTLTARDYKAVDGVHDFVGDISTTGTITGVGSGITGVPINYVFDSGSTVYTMSGSASQRMSDAQVTIGTAGYYKCVGQVIAGQTVAAQDDVIGFFSSTLTSSSPVQTIGNAAYHQITNSHAGAVDFLTVVHHGYANLNASSTVHFKFETTASWASKIRGLDSNIGCIRLGPQI